MGITAAEMQSRDVRARVTIDRSKRLVTTVVDHRGRRLESEQTLEIGTSLLGPRGRRLALQRAVAQDAKQFEYSLLPLEAGEVRIEKITTRRVRAQDAYSTWTEQAGASETPVHATYDSSGWLVSAERQVRGRHVTLIGTSRQPKLVEAAELLERSVFEVLSLDRPAQKRLENVVVQGATGDLACCVFLPGSVSSQLAKPGLYVSETPDKV